MLMVATANAQPYVQGHVFKNHSCDMWSSLQPGDWASRGVILWWMRGFITGYNWFNETNQVTRELSDETMVAFVDKYCRDNPLKTFTQAAAQLICETHDGLQKPFVFCETKK